MRRVRLGVTPRGDQTRASQPPIGKKAHRNTRKGIRSDKAITERKQRRTAKRRIARREQRKTKGEKAHSREHTDIHKRATAQEPIASQEKGKWSHGKDENKHRYKDKQIGTIEKMKYGKGWWIATINVRGTAERGGTKSIGKRDEVEEWMKTNDVVIALIQETRNELNTRESRKEYTWYFSGENPINKEYTAGLAIVIRNDHVKHLEDIVPINDRIMYCILKATMPITIINIHAAQAKRPTEEKERIYNQLNVIIRKRKNKGPLLIGGDWNARIQKAQNSAEREIIGNHTFEPTTERVSTLPDDVKENRDKLMELC